MQDANKDKQRWQLLFFFLVHSRTIWGRVYQDAHGAVAGLDDQDVQASHYLQQWSFPDFPHLQGWEGLSSLLSDRTEGSAFMSFLNEPCVGTGLEDGEEKSGEGRDGGCDDLHHDRARSGRPGLAGSVSPRKTTEAWDETGRCCPWGWPCFWFWWRQGAEMRAVQQVHQSHGWRGEGNPHSGPRALEEMHRPYVHKHTLNTTHSQDLPSVP